METGSYATASQTGSRHSRGHLLCFLPVVACIVFTAGCANDRECPCFAVAKDGNVIFEANGKGGTDLYSLDLKTRKVRTVLRRAEAQVNPACAPDDQRVAFVEWADGRGTLGVLEGGKEASAKLLPSPGSVNAAAFVPGGDSIVCNRANRDREYSFGGRTWDQYDLYLVSPSGNVHKRLTKEECYQAGAPAVTPDGGTVYWQVYPMGGDNNPRIVTVDIRGGAVKTLLETGNVGAGRVDVSPDGKWIVFVSDLGKDYDYQVWVAGTDGKDRRQLTNDKGTKNYPAFSRDGTEVLYVKKGLFGFELWKVPVKGGKATRIAGASLFSRPLSWR